MTTLFTDLVAEVVDITGRPDLIERIERAVSSATLELHSSGFFKSDLREKVVNFPTSSFTQSLIIDDFLPNFRKISLILAPTQIELITPSCLFDDYGAYRTDVAYEAGRVINIKTKVEITSAYILYYSLPDVKKTNYASWIADQLPRAVVAKAASSVSRSTGNRERAAELEVEVKELLSSIIRQEAVT